MPKVKEITAVWERLAPPHLAEAWDNVGLMVGDMEQEVTCVFVCLDVTSANAAQAAQCGADLIVSHHPLLFTPLKQVVESDVTGGIVRALIRGNLSVFSMHTNFDNAPGGMNDLLAEKLGLEQTRPFTPDECVDGAGKPIDNIGRIGVLDAPTEMEDFAALVRQTLGCRCIRVAGDPGDTIRTVALCGGAGGNGIYSAYHAGADVYVTADIRHHEAQLAFELGLNVIDAGHFETENIFCDYIQQYLSQTFSDLRICVSEAAPYFR